VELATQKTTGKANANADTEKKWANITYLPRSRGFE
jgi:hypothetical protein